MVCLLCDFNILLTVFNQSYNCQTSHYGEAHFEILTFDTHRFQIGHFCFNLLLTGIVQPHSVLTWHCFTWTQFCCTLLIPSWYINKFTIIDFTIYTRLFLVKLKSVVDGPILHSKSVVDGSILHCKAKVCVFSKIYDGKIINIPYRNVYQRT